MSRANPSWSSLAGSMVAATALVVAIAWPAAAAKTPPPPKAGAWHTTKAAGSNAKGAFRVAAGRHKVSKLTLKGGDPECRNVTATVKGGNTLRIVNGASGVAGQPEWVAGKRIPGGDTGVNPDQTHVKVSGHTYRASLVMQFPTPGGPGSGYLVFVNAQIGVGCQMNFSFKKG